MLSCIGDDSAFILGMWARSFVTPRTGTTRTLIPLASPVSPPSAKKMLGRFIPFFPYSIVLMASLQLSVSPTMKIRLGGAGKKERRRGFAVVNRHFGELRYERSLFHRVLTIVVK